MSFDKTVYKILIAGLDNAGKTVMYKSAFEDLPEDELHTIPATKGVDRYRIDIEDKTVVFWDLGGQVRYRQDYLRETTIHLNTDCLLFLLDVQQPERFEESYAYFRELCSNLLSYSPEVSIFVFIHKNDPEIAHELRSTIFKAHSLFSKIKQEFPFKIMTFPTSIYSKSLPNALEKLMQKYIPSFKFIYADVDVEEQSHFPTLQKKVPVSTAESTTQELNDLEKLIDETDFSSVDESILTMDGLQDILHEIDKSYRDIAQDESFLETVKTEPDSLTDDLSSLRYNELRSSLTQFEQKFQEINKGKEDIIETSHNIEVQIDPLINYFYELLMQLAKSSAQMGKISDQEIEVVNTFATSFHLLRSEFWHFIKDNDIKAYEIERKLPKLIRSLSNQLVTIATINSIIEVSEKAEILRVLSIIL